MSKAFDRYSSVIFMVIGIFFVVESQKISESAYGSNVGPDMFPTILGAVLVLLSLRLFYETFKYVNEQKGKEELDYKRFFIILISAILYASFIETLGFILTTFLFLLVSFIAMDKKNILKSIVIAACFSGGVYYLFVEVLEGSLPGFPTWF
ncbi:tripartite tricarboxylate transporter TctB family protein [Metabacillus endolithicus]|uniref:Tripartite tricarboxylate transporter TctB family protein n=1 Tax=Metabacillus endolithicus TaxID=1535204 RepID=A0ABW5BXS6_9BACI|nr:tripartite tricarboxylate transporter TctB family protein [Metabacillus endolithicus]UPG65226.1 tripartite tricarboxylate transporter TctB family protein [Metabacillus endolithicus]